MRPIELKVSANPLTAGDAHGGLRLLLVTLAILVASMSRVVPECSAADILIWATDDAEKPDPAPPPLSNPYPSSNHVWTAADTTIRLLGARDEWIACQLVIRPSSPRDMHGIDVTAADLTFGAYRIPRENITLYRAKRIYIQSQHPGPPDGFPGKTGTNWYYDALIPFRDPYPSMAGDVAAPFDVLTGDDEDPAVWVDIHVPADVPAGHYRGTLSVSESAITPVSVHLDVEVWNFTLPATARLMVNMGFYSNFMAATEHVDPRWSGLNDDAWRVLQQYELMAREHRIALDHRQVVPEASFDAVTGALVSIDWSRYDRYMGPILDGTLFPDGHRPNVWMLPIRPYFRVPFATAADSVAVSQMVAEVAHHFDARGWPLDNTYVWIYNEPRSGYGSLPIPLRDEIRAYYRAVKAGDPRANFLIHEAVEDSALVDYMDVWQTRGDKYYPPEIDGLKAAGRMKRAFFYQSYSEPALGVETIDTYGLAYRTWPWIAWKYRVDGCSYWGVNYCDSIQPYTVPDGSPADYNDGNGTLLYPGGSLATIGLPNIAGPVPSFRLKAFRRGMEDYEYLDLLTARGDSAFADSIVNALIPTALCATHDARPIYRGPDSSHYAGPNEDPRGRGQWPRPPGYPDGVTTIGHEAQAAYSWYQARKAMGARLSSSGQDSLNVWLLQPRGGETWGVGTVDTVRWQTSGGGTPPDTVAISIYVSPDGGQTLAETLAVNIADSGAFAWPVAGAVGGPWWCVVRACRGATCAYDTSLAPFARSDSLAPEIDVLSPEGGEFWTRSFPQVIRWHAEDNDTIASVDIDLSLDGGASYPFAIAPGEPDDGEFTWTIPETLATSDHARIRITARDRSGLSSSAESGDFSVVDAAGLDLGFLQNPILTSHLDVYVIAPQRLVPGSLVLRFGEDTLAVAASDTARYVYRAACELPSGGDIAVTACARYEGSLDPDPVCTGTVMGITLIRAGAGGTARSAEGFMELAVPPRAFERNTHVLVTGRHLAEGGVAYNVGPDGTTLGETAEIAFAYDDRQSAGSAPTSLGIARIDGGTTEFLRSYVDTRRHRILALVDRLGEFTLVRGDGTTLSEMLPASAGLTMIRPNPFSAGTTIEYALPGRIPVDMSIYDVRGRLVKRLARGVRGPGTERMSWDSRDDSGAMLPDGIYFVRLVAGGSVLNRKMTLLR